MSDFVIPEATRLAQRRASDPGASAWVSANAGSGKTTVLANRVVRLLLEEVEPGRILCITFTKAAAANMATRVFDLLAQWVTLPDDKLAATLEAMEGTKPSAARLAIARRLFARAIETPGGLKIQTIHAFCERLLHLFPFEANVAARFEVLDDATAAELMAGARRAVLTEAAREGDGPLARALEALDQAVGEDAFAGLVGRAIRLRGALGDRDFGGGGLPALMADLAAALGVPPGTRAVDVERAMLDDGILPGDWPGLVAALRASGKKREQDYADSLAEALAATDPVRRRAAYLDVFLTGQGEPRADNFLAKSFEAARPDAAAALRAEKDRLAGLLERLRAALAVERTSALLTLAGAVARHYDEAKSRRGMLDFDDLIRRTADLLSRRSEAAWVLYKLDQGIDHILIDEAQDTSEPQWQILRALAEDFVSGEGRSRAVRTLFAVGDPKQSIYSFQGAAPEAFETARRDFMRRIGELADRGDRERWRFNDEQLTLSFRSATDVLQAVDAVFASEPHYRSLSFGDPVAPSHVSARARAPGIVDVWEVEQPAPEIDAEAWDKPLDEPDSGSPAVRLAARIARTVARWTREGDETGRRFRPGDVLILVRNRNAVFEAVIRALKGENVPVAGADRLALTRHIAVMDLMAVGRACLLPEDDLTLAAVLKSPFFGLSDEDLERLAVGRRGSLAAALAAAGEGDLVLREVAARFARWSHWARESGPFVFYSRILGAEGGRRDVLARLGAEAVDAVDEFLRLALEHEQRREASLSLFLAALAGADVEIKRDMDATPDAVRVMTVHGAKGLEAPVVFLADTCGAPDGKHDEPVLLLPAPRGPLPVWSPGQKHDPAPVARVRQQGRDRLWAEYHRLLYVAMTRAKDRLVVAGFEGKRARPPGSWYDMVRGALAEGSREIQDFGRPVWRWQKGPAGTVPPEPVAPARVEPPSPDWLGRKAAAEPEPRPPLRPSSASAAADTPPRPLDGASGREADPRRAARRAGELVHLLLERLPERPAATRRAAGAALLVARAADWPEDRRAALLDAALGLIDDPALAPLFGPGSRAELPVAGTLLLVGGPVPVSGQIDRLAVTADAVWIADYKTAAVPPARPEDAPQAYLAQLAVYRALVSRIFPGRSIRTLLVWTAGPVVQDVPAALLDAALARINPA